MSYYIGFASLLLGLMLPSAAQATSDTALRDKIGQMIVIGFHGKQVNANSLIIKSIQKDNLGGVILFDYDFQKKIYDKNIENPSQVKKLNHDLQSFNLQGNIKNHRPEVPLFITIDVEGGKVNRLNERYGFRSIMSPAAVAKAGVKTAEIEAKVMAEQLKQAGFNLDFAPLLDVNTNPANPVIGKNDRSFSNRSNVVIRYAAIYSRQLLEHNVQCAYKHFPGHGSAREDSHLGFVDVTNTWNQSELRPYKTLLNTKNSCDVVMTAHIVNKKLDPSGLPATLSHSILTGLLRGKLHYNGIIMTDDMQMKAIREHYGLEKALVLTINAGADMLVFGNNLSDKPQDPQEVIDIIAAKVKSGEIKQARIEEAYQRILSLKQSLNAPRV